MIKEIAKLLENNLSLTIGTDLIEGHRRSDTADDSDLLLERTQGVTVPELPDLSDYPFQVLSRGTTYFTARARAYYIHGFLHTQINVDLPEVVSGDKFIAEVIKALADPQYVGKDPEGRFEFSTNYNCTKADR